MPPSAKRLLPRIERDEVIEVHEDENAHLWAVSYSDFLMVLLSFFILFYSADPQKRDELIFNLTKDLSSTGLVGKTGAGNGGSASEAAAAAGTEAKRMPAGLMKALADLDVKVTQENEYVVVNFPDDIFAAGHWELRDSRKPLVDKFLAVMHGYEGSFNIYFEGHTDNSPLVHFRSRVVTDNFILSSLRASSALRIAKAAGFNEKALFIQANSSNIRNSRSLSVRIERRKEAI